MELQQENTFVRPAKTKDLVEREKRTIFSGTTATPMLRMPSARSVIPGLVDLPSLCNLTVRATSHAIHRYIIHDGPKKAYASTKFQKI